MAYTATVEIMLPPRGGDWTPEMVGTWRVGTVVAVYVPVKQPSTIAMPRTGYVHVTGIPDAISPQRLAKILTEPWAGQERRIWRVNVAAMTEPGKTALLVDRQIETTWARLKQLSHHMVEDRQATDTDFD
jgi:hypothetical protein